MNHRKRLAASLTAAFTLGVGLVATAPQALAAGYETDRAVRTSANPNYEAPGWWFQGAGPTGHGGGVVAFQSNGDKWWVADTQRDGKSVAVRWKNFVNGSLYREGVCINSNSAPSWATCNKNYREDSTIWASTCLYDGDTGTYSECNLLGFRFRVSDGRTV
ncbi:hypothetical protein [Streptomyces sp. NPDC059256]|uniref:hypothetical protein n=1 Tax=Streptomyces sp. NPDC059256 TaxID=3346794 RepID=UPI00367C21C5